HDALPIWSYGCPGSAMCGDAQNVVARTRMLGTQIAALSGVGSSQRPPAAPLASDAAGGKINAAIADISNSLVSFGVSGINVLGYGAAMPLPTRRLDSAAVTSILAGDNLGFAAV